MQTLLVSSLDELYVLGILNKQTISGWVDSLRKILIAV